MKKFLNFCLKFQENFPATASASETEIFLLKKKEKPLETKMEGNYQGNGIIIIIISMAAAEGGKKKEKAKPHVTRMGLRWITDGTVANECDPDSSG